MSSPALTINELYKLSYAIETRKDLTHIGTIVKEGCWSRLIQNLFCVREPRVIAVIKKVKAAFIQLEQENVKFFNPGIDITSYRQRFSCFKDTFLNIETWVQSLGLKSPLVDREVHNLKCHYIGMRYRIEKANGGKNPKPVSDPLLLEELKGMAQKWKRAHPLAIHKELNAREIEQLEEAAKYKKWVPLLRNQSKYQDDFFNWALRDYNRVDVFIMTPQAQKRIKNALWSPYIGRVRDPHQNQDLLSIEKISAGNGVQEKVLNMKIYDGDYDVFDPNAQYKSNFLDPKSDVIFKRQGYILKWFEAEKEGSLKGSRESVINICAWGMINYHPTYHGPWNPRTQRYVKDDLSQPGFERKVPPFEILQQGPLIKKYGERAREIFVKAMATRVDQTCFNCHAYRQLYFPRPDGTVKVINIGTYAEYFNRNLLEAGWMFALTLFRVFSVLDQNGSYTHRQQAGLPLFLDKPTMDQYLNNLRQVLNRPGFFQVSTDASCAGDVQRGLEKVAKQTTPNLFSISATEGVTGVGFVDKTLAGAHVVSNFFDKPATKPSKNVIVNAFLAGLMSAAQFCRWLVVLGLSVILGSRRALPIPGENGKKMNISVFDYFRKNDRIYNPASLHDRIVKDQALGRGSFVNGELTWGNTDRFYLYA